MSKLNFNKKNINPHKELFRLSGLERYEAIVELKVSERNFICGFYKMCDECPLALYFDNEDGFKPKNLLLRYVPVFCKATIFYFSPEHIRLNLAQACIWII